MTTVENKPMSSGYKYHTVEEAYEANRRNIKEWKIKKRGEYNEYQKEYQRKLREKKKILEQQTAQLQQQLLMYQQQLMLYQQQSTNQSQSNGQQKIIVTPNFTLEILN